MRKPTICICEIKDVDQLRGNHEADQRLCFRYTDSILPLLARLLAHFCDCTAWFVSDLFRNHIVGFLRRLLICCNAKILMNDPINHLCTPFTFILSLTTILSNNGPLLGPRGKHSGELR